MDKRDYYQVLGVNKDATDDQIKSAFRKQAKQYHPDLHPGDKEAEAKFKEVNEAYEVLSDESKRAKYDQFGHAAFDPVSGGAGGAGFDGFGGFEDIFSSFFGGGFGGSTRRRGGPERGGDLRYDLTITFEEAAFGTKKTFTINRNENCETCNGTGAKPGTKTKKCEACGGTGQVRAVQNTILGSISTVTTCKACNGEGKVVEEKCQTCRGRGRISKTREITVSIPAGIDNGQTISLNGQGEAGIKGGPPGDLYVNIRVKPHKLFVRKGFDLYVDMKISFALAAMGGEIEVPTLEGDIKHNIPDGTQPGAVLKLQGKGITRLRGSGKGDLHVRVTVDVPKKLNEKQRELLREFDATFGKQPRGEAQKKGFFDKMKDAFN